MRAVLKIDAARKLQSIQKAVRGFAKPYGYDRFVLFSAASASEEGVEHIYWVEGNWFGDGRGVDAQTYVRRCPITRHVMDAREAFL